MLRETITAGLIAFGAIFVIIGAAGLGAKVGSDVNGAMRCHCNVGWATYAR